MLLNIEKLVYGGDGLARHEGQVVLTPFVAPGEQVEAELQRAKSDLLRGSVTKIVAPSPFRIEPGCPYFYRCGGCQYQHMEYAFQVEQKRAILREVLRRVGKIDFEGEIAIVSGEPWGYRNRTQLHVEDGAIGYFEFGSHRLCPIARCPISSPKLNEVIAALSAELPRLPRFTTTLELFTNETDVQFNISDRVPVPVRVLLDRLASSLPIEYAGFRVSRNSFFQVNRFLLDKLVDAAAGGAEGASAADLYAGVGLFARALSERFAQVVAIEAGKSAHRDLEHNAPSNVTAVLMPAEQFLAQLTDPPDLLLADPPRNGLGKHNVAALLRIRSPQLRIVSCDPATLARDLRGLLDGGYRIESLTLVDLFPQTSHMETVAHLVS